MANSPNRSVNNELYEELGERWYSATDDPVALLRAEAALRNPWLADRIRERHGPNARVLDLGCGAGFLANDLAKAGFEVAGLDLSLASLSVARHHDTTRSVRYTHGDATSTPFASASFDAVCAMDLLEHIEDRYRLLAEVSRVLRPGGTFFFYTFNRNWLAWLVVIKGVEWVLPNTPERLHVLRLFIKPNELREACMQHELSVACLLGVGPVIFDVAFWRLLMKGVVSPGFRFEFTRSLRLGYLGYAERSRRSAAGTAQE